MCILETDLIAFILIPLSIALSCSNLCFFSFLLGFHETKSLKVLNLKEILEIFNKELNGKIQTNISQIKNYCKAEEYHQRYFEKNR